MEIKFINNITDIDNSIRDFFQELDSDFIPKISQRTSLESYINSIFEGNGLLILCLENNQICGILGLITNQPIWKNYIQYIAVSQKNRGKRISSLLLSEAEKFFRNKGVNSITIKTWSSNIASNRIFPKFGFLHVLTIYDDRCQGIHTYIYKKALADYRFKRKIQNIGIIGGMGTYSTATFVDTISNIPRFTTEEQKLISYTLINDSTIPDRTSFILNKKEAEVVAHLMKNVEKLKQLGVSHLPASNT